MKKKSPRGIPDFSRSTQGKKGAAKPGTQPGTQPGAQPVQQSSAQPTGRKAAKPQSTSAKSGHRG